MLFVAPVVVLCEVRQERGGRHLEERSAGANEDGDPQRNGLGQPGRRKGSPCVEGEFTDSQGIPKSSEVILGDFDYVGFALELKTAHFSIELQLGVWTACLQGVFVKDLEVACSPISSGVVQARVRAAAS